MIKETCCSFCLFVLVAGAAMWCGGQSLVNTNRTDEAAVKLPDVVVTASRSNKRALDLPYATSSFSGRDITDYKLSRTTPEILREVPGVMVQKTGHAQGSPYIRGFTGFRTLFLIDGIRLNNSVFRDGPNQYWGTVDPYLIDDFELVKGPSSVMYGSDGIGGTVNALTGSPFDLKSENPYGGRLYYRYSTAEDSNIFRAEGKLVMDGKFGVQAGVTYKDFGDLETGSGHVENSGYTELDFDIKAEYRFSDDARLILAHQNVNQDDAWRTHKTIYGQSFSGTSIGNEKRRVLDQNRSLSYAKFEQEEIDGFVDELEVTISHQLQSETRHRIKSDLSSEYQGFDVNTYGANVQALSDTKSGEWIYGIDYYRDYVDSYKNKYNSDGSFKSRSIQGPVADDAIYDNLGVYVQDTIALHDKVDLILGGRYTYINADSDKYQDPATGKEASMSEDWHNLAGSARVVYRVLPEQGVSLFGGVSQGFRAPNLSDLTRLDTARSNEIETPCTDLDPEEFLCYEAGIKIEAERLTMSASCFYTDISDMIVRTPTGRIVDGDQEVTKKNGGDGYVHGIELYSAYEFIDDWTLWGGLTWMYGAVDTYPTSDPEKVTEVIDRLMPLTGTLGLRWNATDRCWIETFVAMADKADKLSTRDKSDTQRIPPGGTPGYAVFTLRGGCRITDQLNLSVACENIGDKNYRIHGSGLNESGRNFILAADYRF
ncbi:MAG: TonB-dependent receptor [Kiritimatiellae bacterium]|jgi:hemoglobin/transferrin/lactoferrin receptor protein|nr:TonB-dependent receptor [Kiritimatiellia bacterium]